MSSGWIDRGETCARRALFIVAEISGDAGREPSRGVHPARQSSGMDGGGEDSVEMQGDRTLYPS